MKKDIDKNKLLSYFIAEEQIVDHWRIQAWLTDDTNRLIKCMEQRLEWVRGQIKKLEEELGLFKTNNYLCVLRKLNIGHFGEVQSCVFVNCIL